MLAALRDGHPVDRRTYDHVDACVGCRRSLAAGGQTLPLRPASRRAPGTRALVVAAAVLVFAIIAIAPVRSLALGFVEIFEPRTLAFVPMTSAEFAQMQDVPDFSQLGAARRLGANRDSVARDARSASAIAGYRVREPEMPNGATASQFQISSPGIEELTFSEAKAHAWAAGHTVTLRPMPPGMDGAVVRIAFGTIVVGQYRTSHEGPANGVVSGTAPTAYHSNGRRFVRSGPRTMTRYGMQDGIFVAQMPVPRVGSTGVSLQTIEAYLLSQPGVPPKLVAAFAALRDPLTTLPIPIPIDREFLQPAFVDGVWGMGIGDETGLGALIIWERDGFVYGVGGTGKASDILAIANTLR
jgi:hypothetical protein